MIPSTKGSKNNIATQTSVMSNGSSWVICDSKSRPGFKYYFNTESGEAVWNLSNKDQIEKAKKQTHLLHTSLGIVPELPEPQGQPPMNAQTKLKLPMSNFCNFMNTGTRTFNGNVWANPPAVVQQPQIVLVPTVAPMLNPSIGNNNLHPTLALQNALPFTYQNCGNYLPFNNTSSGNMPFNNSNYRGRTFNKNNQFQRHPSHNSINCRQRSEDLRQKLARKRRNSESNSPNLLPYKQENFNEDSNDSENNSPTNEATEEIKNKSTTHTFQLDDCYVVVDKDIILSEFVFFDNLVSNDPNFRLVVPHHVMSELKAHAYKIGEARVRRIVRFLSQKIESRLVYLGEEIEDNSMQNWDKTLITCEKLVENYDQCVILVSNNETKKYRGNNDKIKIMTMCQFKDMLSNTKVRFTSPTRAIKIIIPNNLKIDEKLSTISNIGEETEVERKVTTVERTVTNVEGNVTNVEGNATNVEGNVTNVQVNVTNFERKANVEPKDISSQSALLPSSKHTVDTAVQTEIDTAENKTDCISSETNIEVDKTKTNENTTKKREIRLNRATPMKRPRIEGTSSDKKQFKWRKNRANSSNNSKLTQSTSNVSTKTTDIASNAFVNTDKDIIPNITVTESKQNEDSSHTNTESSFAIPKTNSVVSSIIDREQVKTMPNVSEKGAKVHNENFRKTSTESWIESLPNTRSDTDKDSRSSSYRSVNKTYNFTSNVGKNVNSVVHKVPVKPKNKNIVMRNVEMVTITGPAMEEALRIRSDEWVSRFVQIMEEILKEKLQEDPPFENDDYPPPWNLNEAARCIIKKYSNYFNVVNAANKLSFILYKISDEKEKIPLTLQPSDFMEMYSYGKYLIETLQDVSSNCDELHAAKESLKTLLYDIQNANTENIDVFGEDPHESYVENTKSPDITVSDFRPGQEQSTPKKTRQHRSTRRNHASKNPDTESLHDFGSAKKTSEVPEVSQSKSSSVDKKTSFLSNLKLVTRSISSVSPSTIASPTYSNLTVRSPIESPLPVATKVTDNNDTSNKKEPPKNDEDIVSSSGQPNFVRNFQICPEFEARINKARSILELDDCDEPYLDDDHCDDDGFQFNISQPENCTDNTSKDVPVFVDDSNKKGFNKFRWSFGDPQLRYVKETFADIIDNLSVTTSDPTKKDESKSFAIKMFPCIENIYKSLDTILKKNVCYSDANIKEILKNVNANSTEKELFYLQYRNTITQFRDQAYNIIKYLKLILSTS